MGSSTEGVMRKAAILGAGPYAIPNVRVDTYGIYTNNTPSGAFRSFGALQTQFATESHLDICAERLGLDPFEIRRINAMRDGAVTHTKQKLGSGQPHARASTPPRKPPAGSRARPPRAAPARHDLEPPRHPPAGLARRALRRRRETGGGGVMTVIGDAALSSLSSFRGAREHERANPESRSKH